MLIDKPIMNTKLKKLEQGNDLGCFNTNAKAGQVDDQTITSTNKKYF